MRQTVRTAIHACCTVLATQRMKPPTPTPTRAAVMIADNRIAVPVASGWKPQTAA